jgi:DNA-binding MarR family transcriptional regulator
MTGMSEEQYRDLAAFRKSLRLYQRTLERVARQVGVTPAQHQLLVAVRGAPEGFAPSVSWLADELQLEAHSVTGLVGRAEGAGLVTTQATGEDGRVRTVHITPAGQKSLTDMLEGHNAELDGARRQLLRDLRRVQRER